MTALYIIIGIMAVVCLLVFSSIKIRISYDEQIKLSIGYLFLNFRILPSKISKDKNRKKIESKAKKSKSGSIKVGEIIDIVKCVLENLKPVLKAVRIKPLVFDVAVADEDAAVTAIKTGAVNAAVWTFVGWLSNTVKVSKQAININPNYDLNEHISFKTCICIRLNHIIAAGFGVLVGIYKLKFIKDGA